MFHLVRSPDGTFGVVNVADNGRVLSENYGFNRKENCYKNMWAQVDGIVIIGRTFYIPFQDDTGVIPISKELHPAFLVKGCDRPIRKKYIPKRKRK